MKIKILKEDLETEFIALRITPRYDKTLDSSLVEKIMNLLKKKYELLPSQIINKQTSLIIKKVPLEFYGNITKDLDRSKQIKVDMIGHYSDDKFFDSSKNKYTSEPGGSVERKYTTVIESKNKKINENTYASYMEEETLEENVDPMQSYEELAIIGDWKSPYTGEELEPYVDPLFETSDPGCIYDSYEFDEELGEDNENKTYLDKVNDEAHTEPYENWISMTDDEDPDDILLTEADINSSESKGKMYRFIGDPTFMNQYLCSKLDGYNVNYNAVYEDDEDENKLLEVDVYVSDLQGTGLTIRDLDDWLEDRSLGDWNEYRSVQEINEVNSDEIDFRGGSENTLQGPLEDTYMFMDEELSYNFDFLDDSALVKNPLLLGEDIGDQQFTPGIIVQTEIRDKGKIIKPISYKEASMHSSFDPVGDEDELEQLQWYLIKLDSGEEEVWPSHEIHEIGNLNEMTTADIAVPSLPAFSHDNLKTKMVDPVKQTKLTENKKLMNKEKLIRETLEKLHQEVLNEASRSENIAKGQRRKNFMDSEELNSEGEELVEAPYDPGFDDEEEDDDVQYEVEVGDLVDFGDYGQLYVVRLGGDRWRVTDREEDRDNPDASGWNIRPSYAKRIIEKYEENEEDDYLDESKKLNEETFPVSKAPNLANSLNNNYKKADKENSDSKMDPYKNASNIVKGTKTEVKKKHSILEGEYRIMNYNIKDKGVEKFSVLVESNNTQRELVSFAKKDFAKFIFENCSTKNYVKEGKFDYQSYINSRPYSFITTLLESYFSSKFKK